MPTVAIIDYQGGNIRSVTNALQKQNADVEVVSDARGVERADAVVLPGVGAFADAMEQLRRAGLTEVIVEAIDSGKPFLGICLGLQMLFEESEEDGPVPGLGVLPGRVVRFRLDDPSLKIPHMGWNALSIKQPHPVLADIDEGDYVYFVHSYYVAPEDESLVATTTDYGISFCSSVARGNLFASQFHPEKSQSVGLKMLAGFVRSIGETADRRE